jgi:hypothetical protein
MKKARNIKIIKPGGAEIDRAIKPPEIPPTPPAVREEDLDKAVKAWVSEHRKEKKLAEQAARRFLSNLTLPPKEDEGAVPMAEI